MNTTPISFLRVVVVLILTILSQISAIAAEVPTSLAAPLEALRPLLGKTWKGAFKDSTPEKPIVDVSRWERALNGQAVRILHSINSGEYGGETIIMWNPKTERIEYRYFTTAGFFTEGTMKMEGNKIITNEKVTGSAGGVTEVEATSELRADGKLQVKSRYLKDGSWTEGHEILYEETKGAEVIFK